MGATKIEKKGNWSGEATNPKRRRREHARGVWGHAPPENFWKIGQNLCNLAHFKPKYTSWILKNTSVKPYSWSKRSVCRLLVLYSKQISMYHIDRKKWLKEKANILPCLLSPLTFRTMISLCYYCCQQVFSVSQCHDFVNRDPLWSSWHSLIFFPLNSVGHSEMVCHSLWKITLNKQKHTEMVCHNLWKITPNKQKHTDMLWHSLWKITPNKQKHTEMVCHSLWKKITPLTT